MRWVKKDEIIVRESCKAVLPEAHTFEKSLAVTGEGTEAHQ